LLSVPAVSAPVPDGPADQWTMARAVQGAPACRIPVCTCRVRGECTQFPWHERVAPEHVNSFFSRGPGRYSRGGAAGGRWWRPGWPVWRISDGPVFFELPENVPEKVLWKDFSGNFT